MPPPTINAATIATLASGAYLDAGEPVVLLGDSGTGKSHLLIGLGIAACEQGRRVRYATAAQLVNELAEAADERRHLADLGPLRPPRSPLPRRARLRPTRRPRLRPLPAASEPAFPLEHNYFEVVYTPLVGPMAVLLARAMARHLDVAGGPTTVCPVELAPEVGIRASSWDTLGKRSHLVHGNDRLAHDHIVSRLGDRDLGLRRAIPLLSERVADKLPIAARQVHFRLLAAIDRDSLPGSK